MNDNQQQILDWLKPESTSRGTTRMAVATAVSESSGGQVVIDLDVEVLSGDGAEYSDTTTVTLPTTEYVQAGDKVVVSFFDVDGAGTPMVTGVYGGGDKMATRIAALEG